MSNGYKEQPSKTEMFRQAASIKGIKGVELIGSWDVTLKTITEVKKELQRNGLECVCVIPDHFSEKRWGNGAFTSRDSDIRRHAIETTKEYIDVAIELGCDLINLWPGQDGYDYPIQGNFLESRQQFCEAIRECAKYQPEIRISLEYKLKEPRTHCYLSGSANTLLLALDTGRENVGVTIDTGHALLAQENVGESIAVLMEKGKLFHMHFNDNYRSWDDDMIVGSIHLTEYIEMLYWLDRMNYEGWYSMDQYPYRENGQKAIDASIRFLEGTWNRMEQIGLEYLDRIVENGNSIEMNSYLRKFLGY